MAQLGDFDAAFDYWFAECNKLVTAFNPHYKLTFKRGRKWLSVFIDMNGQKESWALLDFSGNIYRSAGNGSTPAEHIRGSLFAPDRGLRGMTWLGPESR